MQRIAITTLLAVMLIAGFLVFIPLGSEAIEPSLRAAAPFWPLRLRRPKSAAHSNRPASSTSPRSRMARRNGLFGRAILLPQRQSAIFTWS